MPHENLFDWTDDQDSPVCAQRAYWADIEHAVGRTPHDRPVGLVCHNCYAQPGRGSENEESEAATRNLIRNAQLAGADLIELDLKEEGGVIYVDHEDDDGTGGSRFDVVLAFDDLGRYAASLHRIKGRQSDPAFIERLLRDLQRFGMALRDGRFSSARSTADERTSSSLADSWHTQNLPTSARIFVSTFSSGGTTRRRLLGHTRDSLKSEIWVCMASSFITTTGTYSPRSYARSLGLGVTLFTIPVRMGEVFIANSRDLVDALVLDYPLAAGRAVVEDDNALVNLDMSTQTGRNRQIVYQRTDAQNRVLPSVERTPQRWKF